MATRKKPVIKLPSKFTPAEVRVNEQGKVQIRINPAKLGSGGRFAKCVESVTAKGGAVDPRAVCAAAGRKKYGAKKFAAMGRAGRKRRNPFEGTWEVTHLKKVGTLAAKLRRRGTEVTQRGNTLYITGADGLKPWAELAGHMTTATQVIPYRD
jgi:hypothetical protein